MVCSDEVAYIKESLHRFEWAWHVGWVWLHVFLLLCRDEDCLKIKSKTGVITYKAFQEK